MRLIERLNILMRYIVVRRVIRIYNKKIDFVLKNRPELLAKVPEEEQRKHLELYGRIGLPCNDKWLRMYSNLSGIVDYRYVPESIYSAVIERVLNDCECGNHEYEDKNIFEKLIDREYLPETIVRYVRGIFFDCDFNYISYEDVSRILSCDNGILIGKEATESSGGKGVIAFTFIEGKYISNDGIVLNVNWIINHQSHYIIQKKLSQCDFTAQFNPSSVNTCRMMTLRCPWDGKVVLLKSILRMGVTEIAVDNLSSGGICVGINPEGELDTYAYTFKEHMPLSMHPSSKIEFKGLRHPFFKSMTDVVIKEAKRIPNYNIISWDVIADVNGNIKIIEANIVSQNPDITQLSNGPLFGEYTEQIVDWVVNHEKFLVFKHFRTF